MSSVRVVLRIRPLSNPHSSNASLSIPPNQNPYPRVVQASNAQFTFDYVASPLVTQRQLFESIGSPVIDSCLQGFNGTIFCYGQTGSGKTYTMTGPDSTLIMNPNHEERGMIPRILESLFDKINALQSENPSIEFFCSCSFLEIYNEQIMDLLGDASQSLQLRENISHGVYVEGLNHEKVSVPEEALQLLYRGLEQRHTGETKANAKSSRSHSVFTIYIQSKEIGEVTTTKTARLNLIDLAGSERQSHTSAEGVRLTEACKINKSLSTLGQVILALSERQKGRSMHVHYRDSKLTFLLRDSLGGNSKTCIVSNVSADPKDLSETVSTLKFAQRAKRIRNKPIANQNVTGNIALLQEQIRRLRHQLIEANERIQIQEQQTLSGNQMVDVSNDHHRMVDEDTVSEATSCSNEGAPFRAHPKEGETVEHFNMYLKNVALSGCYYNRRLRRALRRNHETIDLLLRLNQASEKLFLACRFALKSREWELAKLQGRQPKLDMFHRGKNGVLSIELDPKDEEFLTSDDDEMLDEEHMKDVDFDDRSEDSADDLDIIYTEIDDGDPLLDLDDDNDRSYSHNQLSHAERILSELYHPDNHPAVLLHMHEAARWRDKCLDFEDTSHDSEYFEGLKQAITYCERKLKQYFDELSKKKEEIRKTDERMQTVNKLKQHMQKKNEELTDIWNQKMEWENRYKVLQEKLKRQQVLIDEQTTKMKSLQEDLSQREMIEEEGKILKNASAVAETEQQLEKAKSENQTLLKIVDRLENEKEILKNQYQSGVESETQRLNNLLEQKTEELKSMHQQFNTQYSDLQTKSESQIRELKSELNTKMDENNRLRKQIHKFHMSQSQPDSKKIQEYESKIQEYQHQTQKLQNELKAERSKSESNRSQFDHQLKEQNSQIESMKVEMENRMNQANDEMSFLKEENARMKKALSQNKNQEQDLMMHANNAVSEKMAELHFELRQLREQNTQMQREKGSIMQELEATQKQLNNQHSKKGSHGAHPSQFGTEKENAHPNPFS